MTAPVRPTPCEGIWADDQQHLGRGAFEYRHCPCCAARVVEAVTKLRDEWNAQPGREFFAPTAADELDAVLSLAQGTTKS